MAGTFAADISRFCNQYKADMRTVVRKITFEAFSRVVLKTAVKSGRARANWSVSQGQPVTFQIEAFDKTGTATLKKLKDGVDAWECQGSLFLSNSVPYIIPLEYGHSKQFPQGMVRITLEEMLQWVRGVSAK